MSTPIVSHAQNVMLNFFNCLDLSNAVVPLMMPLGSFDANGSVSCFTWQQKHIGPYFEHLYLRIAIVLLMTLSESHDGATIANGIM